MTIVKFRASDTYFIVIACLYNISAQHVSVETDLQDDRRHVRKIRSPRRWSCEERFTRDPATLACSLAPPPPSNLHKTEPAAKLSLDWVAVHDGALSHFSHQVRVACNDPFFECQGHYPH